MTKQKKITFDKYVVIVEQVDFHDYFYNLFIGGINIGYMIVIQNKISYNLITEFEIFPQFRRQGHGTAFLKWICNYLRGREIRLYPVAIYDDLNDKKEIIEKVTNNRTSMEFKTARLIKFYRKRGFKLNVHGNYMYLR